MMLKCEKQCTVYNETAKSIASVLESFGLKEANIGLEPDSDDFSFDCDKDAPVFCKDGWFLVDGVK